MVSDENKYNNLVKNSAIFAIGTFGSKVLQFLIVPLYTYVLTTTEYGQIDLFSTTISLLLPFVTLLIQESIIRFLTAGEITSEEAVSIGLAMFFCSGALSIIASVIYIFFFGSKFVLLFFFCLILNSYIAIFQNYLKAYGKISEFMVCGLLNTFLFLIGNVYFLTIAKKGIWGYLYALFFSLVCSAIYISIKGKIFQNFRIKAINRSILKEMLRFSIPLIPNNLMWWIMNAGDKYIINYFLGDAANGVYSISIKLATVITTVFSVFMQAWQLSAIKESGNDEQANFYSKVYVIVMALLFISCSLIITFTRPIFSFVISDNFFEANRYSPLLCVATVLNCLSTFVSVSYIVNKNTKNAFFTTAMGAVVNVFANFLLIKVLGLTGIAIGTIIGYLVVVVLRVIDMKKYLNMNFDWIRTIGSMTIIIVLSIVYLFVGDLQIVIIGMLCSIILFLLYIKEIKSLLKILVLKFV